MVVKLISRKLYLIIMNALNFVERGIECGELFLYIIEVIAYWGIFEMFWFGDDSNNIPMATCMLSMK